MRRLALAALLFASAGGLGGCLFAVGSTEGSDGRRLKKLEHRISKAEKALNIPEEAKQ